MSEFKKLTSKTNISNKEELDMYLAHIHHDDYPSDKYWTVEDTTKVGEQVGIDFTKWRYNKFSFNFVMNMVKADYLEELTKMFKQSTVLKDGLIQMWEWAKNQPMRRQYKWNKYEIERGIYSYWK